MLLSTCWTNFPLFAVTVRWIRGQECGVETVVVEEQTQSRVKGGQDKHGRTLADVLSPAGTHVNHKLVKDGWCWWYQKYAPKDLVSRQLEQKSREHKKGV